MSVSYLPSTPAQLNALPPEQAALAWLAVMQGQPSAAQRRGFDNWLYADAAHVEAYAQAQGLWQLTEAPAQRLALEEAPALAQYLDAMQPSRKRTAGRWWLSLATAASVLLMLGLLGLQPERWLDAWQADYVSAPGQLRQITLEDQSVVLLDADSAIRVDFSDQQRHIDVLRGAAFFQVTHTGQPFVVSAAEGEARVLGTQFEVRRRSDGAQVTVKSGRVAVTPFAGAPAVELGAGQQQRYGHGVAQAVQQVDAEASLAWRQGWLTVYQMPLAQVLDEVQRYSPGRIVLLNPALAQRRVSGSFPCREPDKVLDSLASVVGFQRHQLLGLTLLR